MAETPPSGRTDPARTPAPRHAADPAPRLAADPAPRLAALLLGAGVLHFLAPKPFDSTVPTRLPGTARAYTYGSGVVELGVGTALLIPRTRRLGGRLAALLFVAVFPANIKFAVDSVRNPRAPWPLRAVSVLRLPLQWPLISRALAVSRTTPPPR